ncbi:uncharacterized protein LOC111362327 [Spodoptera litura]|uniref:Uncharacterized protein LOC111362327 n=2 Tax=Spodoptera litura TaxID=69820 RepID=A0A9J7J308_SPOLT|nr:uncharacterized protein LOC111362327 [Spodoptera litura]
MEKLNPCPILEFNDSQLLNVRKSFGYDDLHRLKQDVDHLQDWINQQPHFKLKEFDRDFLERYLIYCKGSIERAKQRFDKLCTYTNQMPEFLRNFDIRNEFIGLNRSIHTCILPKPTADNYRVIISTVSGEDGELFDLMEYYRYLIVLGEYMMHNDYCHGYELVGVSTNVSMAIVKKLNPIIMHKAVTLITDALGQRMKKIHLISDSKFFETILVIFKQALTAKLAKRLIVHNSFESLHEHITREHLPKDLGGDEKTMKELAEMDFKAISSDEHIAFVKRMETATTDESLRPCAKFNEDYSGTPGSFKTLCVD